MSLQFMSGHFHITATELFIEHLTASSAELTLNKGRKVISRSDVDEVSAKLSYEVHPRKSDTFS